MKNNIFVDEEGMDIILYYNIVTEYDKKDIIVKRFQTETCILMVCYMAILNSILTKLPM